jgi:hypothetical protein
MPDPNPDLDLALKFTVKIFLDSQHHLPPFVLVCRSAGADTEEAEVEEPEAAMEDLVPRQNISGPLT